MFPVWATANVERHIGGFLAPETWFGTLDGIFTIVGTALAVRWWTLQDRGPVKPSEIRRITVGFVLAGSAYAILAFGAWLGRPAPGGLGMTPMAAAVAFFLFADFAIPWTDTVTMAVITREAPPSINTTMIGVYYLFYGAGNFLTGWLGGQADRMTMPAFWLMHAAILGVCVLVLVLFGGAMRRGLRPPEPVAA